VAPQIGSIVVGSTIKGLITGVLIGFFARKVSSLPLGIVFGLAVGAFLAFLVALGNHYYLEMMLPGAGPDRGHCYAKNGKAAPAVAK
jgi:hypothetical protein